MQMWHTSMVVLVACCRLTQASDPWTSEVALGVSEVASVDTSVDGNSSVVVCSRKLSCARVTQTSTLVLTEFEVSDYPSPSRPLCLPCLGFSQTLPFRQTMGWFSTSRTVCRMHATPRTYNTTSAWH